MYIFYEKLNVQEGKHSPNVSSLNSRFIFTVHESSTVKYGDAARRQRHRGENLNCRELKTINVR